MVSSAAGSAATRVAAFLRTARHRALLGDLLAAALVSAAADVVLRLGVIALGRQLSRELPAFFEGIYLFVVLAVLAWRRQTLERVARRVDRHLRLKDRLATFLDFRAREDLAPGFVAAQAAEAAATLEPIAPRRAVAISRWLWAGPPALVWMLYMSYFAFFRPEDLPPPIRIARVGPPLPGAPRPPAAEQPPQASPTPDVQKAATSAGGVAQPDRKDSPGRERNQDALPWENPAAKTSESAPPREVLTRLSSASSCCATG